MTRPVDPTAVTDVVIVLPGIMGSTLVGPDGKHLWSLRPGTLTKALFTLGRSLGRLKLPAGIGDNPAPDGIRPGELLPALHVIPGIWSPVAGYAGLVAFLRSSRFHLVEPDPRRPELVPNLIMFPYDWRLSNRYNATLLAATAFDALERWQSQPGMQDAKLILVCHSMGGLVARWFLEQEGGAAHTRHLVTIGTPHRGSVKALDMLSNGIERGVGPIRFSLTDVARSLPSMHQLLPTYRCLAGPGGARSALAGVAVPGIDAAMLADAGAFHRELTAAPPPAYGFHKVVGTRQPTLTTARLVDGGVRVSDEIDGKRQGGDGTVPRLSAETEQGRGAEVHEVADQHGELHGTRSAVDLVDGILSRQELIFQGVDDESFGVRMSDVWALGEPPTLTVPELADRRLLVTVVDEHGDTCGPPVPVRPDGTATLEALPPGGYRARVASPVAGGPSPVTHPFLVWDPEIDLDGDPAGDLTQPAATT